MPINWFAALSIEERLKILKTENPTKLIDESALFRLEAHNNLYAPCVNDFLNEKLRFEFEDKTISKQDITQAYSNYESSVFHNHIAPFWLLRLTESYHKFDITHPDRLKFQSQNKTTQAFWSFFEPLLSHYALEMRSDLQQLATKYDQSFINTTQLERFLEPAIEKIAIMAERAFVLELRVAKQAGELVGNDTHERFDYFFEQLKQPTNALLFFEIYPVLGRLAVNVCENWKMYFLEIVSNLYEDMASLKTQIAPLSNIHTLCSISSMLSDGPQTGGRSVAILTFNDNLKVVYKPRDLGVDVAYGQFLRWFNAQNIVPPLEHFDIISRPNHAWSAFVGQDREMTYEELPVLYAKLGALLCLMYLFDTVDMHGDNTIVVGDNPLMIDLETLLQPSLPDDDIMAYRSVRQTLFLPSVKNIVPDADDLEGTEGIDLSKKTWTEHKQLIWEDEGTDCMRIVRKRLPVNKDHNCIVIGENVINAADYAPFMVKSFRKTYRHIAANPKDFLEAVAQCFQEKKLRVILRGSKKYDALVEDMAHPSNLQDGLVLDQFLDRLWIEADDFPALKLIIGHEKRDLLNLDNAYFYTHSNSTSLFYNDQTLSEGFFETAAFDRITQNVNVMSAKDLEKQVRIIKKSFAELRESLLAF